MPEVLKGALLSRYSRSSLGLREVFLKDYINNKEAGAQKQLKALKNFDSSQSTLNTEKAKNFYSKWLAMYGDDSIAELGGIQIAVEGISVVATKAIEDRRVGISPLEKSTRYVRFDTKVKGKYLYYRDPKILAGEYGKDYVKTMDNLFNTYAKLIQHMTEYFCTKFPKAADVSDSAYTMSIRAKACDTVRGLLPMATLTNMGFFANGRAVEYLLTNMYSSPLTEVKNFAKLIHNESKPFIGNFVERVETDLGDNYINYLKKHDETVKNLTDKLTKKKFSQDSAIKVTLFDSDKDAELKIAAAVLYPNSQLSYKELTDLAKKLSQKQLSSLFNDFVAGRLGRWHKVGKAFEDIYYTFEIVSDQGAYKDLQRHRMTSMTRQNFTTKHGYIVPQEIREAGLDKIYSEAMDMADALYCKIEKTLPYEAQYASCHGNLVRWKVKMNLREAFHLCELRSSPQGHPNYRFIAQEIHKRICEKHPLLGKTMKFVNLSDPGLERLSAEIRKEQRLKDLQELGKK